MKKKPKKREGGVKACSEKVGKKPGGEQREKKGTHFLQGGQGKGYEQKSRAEKQRVARKEPSILSKAEGGMDTTPGKGGKG